MTDFEKGTITFSKVDSLGSKEIAGAAISLTYTGDASLEGVRVNNEAAQISENVISFTSGNTPTAIAGLPDGEYEFKEVAAPEGFEVTETTVVFKIDGGKIKVRDGETWVDSAETSFKLEDAPKAVSIDKKSLTGDEEIADAVYKIICMPDYLTGQIITIDGGWT